MLQSIVNWLSEKGYVHLKVIEVYTPDSETLKMLSDYKVLIAKNYDLMSDLKSSQSTAEHFREEYDRSQDDLFQLRKHTNNVITEYESQIDFYENKRNKRT